MGYVEWLRVRGCLKWTGIVLGVLFLVAVGLRIYAGGVEHDLYGKVAQLKSDPGSQVTDVVLPDGTHRTTIYDPAKKVRAVIDDNGDNGMHVVVDDWSPTAKQDMTRAWHSGGVNFKFVPDRHGKAERYDVTLDGPTPLYPYFIVGMVVALIVATCLGAPFARESDGHLEVALTKPISRDVLALQTILIDCCGLLAAFFGAALLAIATHALFAVPHLTVDNFDLIVLGAGIAGPLAWYGMLAAATSSLRRGYGVIQGLAWPIALVVVGLSHLRARDAISTVLHNVAWTLSWIDPLRYLHFGRGGLDTEGMPDVTRGTELAILAAMAVVYLALAVVQWRRIEA